ncbi:hypothetical protein [Paraburkholderia sp.]|uniref:hypothetical protein n=1 Tax=Paraburkholderia sp. TaxID=1926495 RepID=UPI00238A2AAB|nr:hypothetical protein [Paraburkholderia sp.]MDE1179485.1 hypothetical protein [Paraburkholderia sp.]
MYGDPMEILAAKQAEAANKARRAIEAAANAPEVKRPTLTLKRKGEESWSAARRAAEDLFVIPLRKA